MHQAHLHRHPVSPTLADASITSNDDTRASTAHMSPVQLTHTPLMPPWSQAEVPSPSGASNLHLAEDQAAAAAAAAKRFHRSKTHVPSAVPRPPNAWILYRSARLRDDAAAASSSQAAAAAGGGALVDLKLRQGDLSKRLSEAWKAESAQVRAHFYALASQRQEEHRLAYPDYKYAPRVTDKLAKAREARTLAAAAAKAEKLKLEEEEAKVKPTHEVKLPKATRPSRKRALTAPKPPRPLQSPGSPPCCSAQPSPRVTPYPPTSPRCFSPAKRSSIDDDEDEASAPPALLSLSLAASAQPFRRPSYGRRSISEAAADWTLPSQPSVGETAWKQHSTPPQPMMLDPSLWSEPSASSSAGSASAVHDSFSPQLHSPLELDSGTALGMFEGVGAPTYDDTVAGSNGDFMLPDAFDHQAAMLLLLSDNDEDEEIAEHDYASSGATPSYNVNAALHMSPTSTHSNDARLLASPAVSARHYDSSSSYGAPAAPYQHSAWSTAQQASPQAFKQPVEMEQSHSTGSVEQVHAWPAWGKPLPAAFQSPSARAQPMLHTQSESSQHVYRSPASHTHSPALQLHHVSPAQLHHGSASTVSSSAPSLAASPHSLSSARNFTRALAAPVSPAQTLHKIRRFNDEESLEAAGEIPWDAVVADAQRAFRRSQTVGAEPSTLFDELHHDDEAHTSSLQLPGQEQDEEQMQGSTPRPYAEYEEDATEFAQPSGQVSSLAPSLDVASAQTPSSPLLHAHDDMTMTQENHWPSSATAAVQASPKHVASHKQPALELKGSYTEADLLAQLEVLRTQRQLQDRQA